MQSADAVLIDSRERGPVMMSPARLFNAPCKYSCQIAPTASVRPRARGLTFLVAGLVILVCITAPKPTQAAALGVTEAYCYGPGGDANTGQAPISYQACSSYSAPGIPYPTSTVSSAVVAAASANNVGGVAVA
jgi:hypothetical protein